MQRLDHLEESVETQGAFARERFVPVRLTQTGVVGDLASLQPLHQRLCAVYLLGHYSKWYIWAQD